MTSLRETRGGFWLSLVIPAAAAALFSCRHPWAFVLGGAILVPLADALIGTDASRTNVGGCRSSSHAIPILYLLGWVGALCMGFTRAQDAGTMDWTGLVFGAGLLSAFAMAHLHEVMHRASRAHRVATDLAFVIAGYPHYRIAHQLHHAHVGDPRFGSTAHSGLSVWKHVVRSFFSATKSSIIYESTSTRAWSNNRIVRIYCVAGAVIVAAFVVGSWRGGAFYVGQGLISAFVVEVIGYVQHYGLEDTALTDGQTAWDVNYWLSNRLLSNNGLHTHHHQEKTLTYCDLTSVGPALPGGYLHMFWVALIPSLWFSTMSMHAAALRTNARSSFHTTTERSLEE